MYENQYRSHHCNELRLQDVGKEVKLAGWCENFRRVSKKLGFLILRDYFGITQVVIETDEMLEKVSDLNKETVVQIFGMVKERTSKNETVDTGDIEIAPTRIEILGKCVHNELPFEINHSRDADENIRLKYRYLDLRNPEVKKNIVLRCNVISELRKMMSEQGFLEITTPILTASSPEGARDYLVPSRNFPGKFYALPQAPQQFKQLLMASGFDKYFQIAPCFRDEDARADRSPGEFYQLDMEMAFATQEDVFNIIEQVIPPVFKKFGVYNECSEIPFPRIPYFEAMEKYGTDKPDLRINLTVQDITDISDRCSFDPFKGHIVKAIVAHEFLESRKYIDRICEEIKGMIEKNIYWLKVKENDELAGGVAKYFIEVKEALKERLNLECGDVIFLVSGERLREAQKAAGVVRKVLGNKAEKYIDKEKYKFCWIVDFPMYELSEETGEIVFCHNPFSMPQGGIEALKNKDPLEILAYQYDLVCNGVELSSGAVRNHNPDIMMKAFDIIGLGEKDVRKQFAALYNAFSYGAPPHAGIAPGVDRMIMLLSGEENIREIIPFPMNSKAQDLMCNAPNEVSYKQLEEIHIKLKE